MINKRALWSWELVTLLFGNFWENRLWLRHPSPVFSGEVYLGVRNRGVYCLCSMGWPGIWGQVLFESQPGQLCLLSGGQVVRMDCWPLAQCVHLHCMFWFLVLRCRVDGKVLQKWTILQINFLPFTKHDWQYIEDPVYLLLTVSTCSDIFTHPEQVLRIQMGGWVAT